MLPVDIGFNESGALNDSDARLIWELVAEIHTPSAIIARRGLSAADFKAKMKDRMFVAAYREAKSAWKSELNVQQRVKLKAGLLLEDSLMDILLIIKDPLMATTHKLEATKQLGQLSQTINPKPTAVGEGSQFKLTINLGDKKGVTIDGIATHQPVAIEG